MDVFCITHSSGSVASGSPPERCFQTTSTRDDAPELRGCIARALPFVAIANLKHHLRLVTARNRRCDYAARVRGYSSSTLSLISHVSSKARLVNFTSNVTEARVGALEKSCAERGCGCTWLVMRRVLIFYMLMLWYHHSPTLVNAAQSRLCASRAALNKL